MIVNPTKQGWQIIYHRAHALLAAELASHLRPELRPIRWIETLAAIVSHDDMEREWEADDHLTEAGTPRDFTMGRLTLDGPNEITTDTQYRGRWVALLISMHQSFLLEPQRGTNTKLDQFLDLQLENQKNWRKQFKLNDKEAQNAYAVLQWCDRLSLILCQQELPNRERALEISKGPDNVRYDVLQRDDGSINVTPWPFDVPQFPVSIETSCLSEARYASNRALQKALKDAPIEVLSWQFSEKPLPGAKEDHTPAN